MTQKILKVGTSLAVTIPKNIQEGLEVGPGDFVETDFDKETKVFSVKKKTGTALVKGGKNRITKLTLSFIDRYRKDLEALRDK